LFASLTGGIPPEVGLNRLTNNRLLIVLNAFLSFIPLVWFYTEIYNNLPLYKRLNNKMWRFPSYHVLLIVLSSLISVWAYPTIALLCVATGCIFWLENRESFIMKPEIKPEIKKGSYDAWIKEIDRKSSPKKFSNNYRKYSIFFSISACTLSSLVANIISWGIASKIMGEKILAGVVFPKGDLIEQILVLIQPMSQVAIYGIMMSAAMVMFIKFPESEKK
jgi:hypothetical protein